jgi:hypothetical protein
MAPSGIPAVFHLSPEGEQALELWIGKRRSFSAFMRSYDPVGAWILPPGSLNEGEGSGQPVMLLKWTYITTVTFEMFAEQPLARAPIGFVTPSGG